MDTDNLQAEGNHGSDKSERQDWRLWMLGTLFVLALILAAGGVIYAWQANANSQLASLNLASAQSAEQDARNAAQDSRHQLATAEGAGQKALEQLVTAQSQAQTALSAQATAESKAEENATAEAQAVLERNAAQEQANLATSRSLARAALDTLPLDPQLSGNLALQAIETGYTFEAENALHQVLPNLRLLKSTLITDIVPGADDFHPDNLSLIRNGELLIVGTDQGIEVVNMVSGAHSLLAQGQSCTDIFITQDGRWLVAECSTDQVDQIGSTINAWQIYEIDKKILVSTLPDYGSIGGLVSPTSTHPVLIFNRRSTEHVWDATSGEERFTPWHPSGDEWIGAVASPDGKRLATWTWSGNALLALWDINTGEKLFQFDAQHWISSIIFSPDGMRLATVGDDESSGYETLKIWDISSYLPEDRLMHEIFLTGLSNMFIPSIMYSPDGLFLAAGSSNGQLQVWNSETGDLRMTLSGHVSRSWPLSFNQDGSRLYTGSWDGTLKEWDLSPGEALMTLSGRTGSVPYSPDGSRMALMTDDGFISIVDSQTGEVQLSWQAHTNWSYYYDVAWSPSGDKLATVGNGQAGTMNLKIWETAKGQLLKEIPGRTYGEIAWSPDSSRIAAIQNGNISIWDAASGEELLSLYGHMRGGVEVVFSQDGSKIATEIAICGEPVADCYGVMIWDASNGEELFMFPPANGGSHIHYLGSYPSGLAFSPSEYLLAAGIPGGSIALWRVTDEGSVQEQVLAGAGTSAGIQSIAFNSDGTMLAAIASGDEASRIRVWDLESGQLRWEEAMLCVYDCKLAFSPDGTRLASSWGGITTIHVLPLDELTELVRSRLVRPMTQEECLTYLHRDTCPAGP